MVYLGPHPGSLYWAVHDWTKTAESISVITPNFYKEDRFLLNSYDEEEDGYEYSDSDSESFVYEEPYFWY